MPYHSEANKKNPLLSQQDMQTSPTATFEVPQ